MSKLGSTADEWLSEERLTLLQGWARDGVSMRDICYRMDVAPSTLAKWRKEYSEIDEALRKGKEIVDYQVENALLKAALGHTTKEIKVTIGRRVINGEIYEITKETTTKEVAPNVTACLAWLNNKLPDKWKRNRDKSFEDDIEDTNLKVTIIRGAQDDENSDTNKEIKIEKNNSKEDNLVNPGNKDFWPEDWEDEE